MTEIKNGNVKKKNLALIMLVLSVIMMLCGSWIGGLANTSWGDVIVKDVEYFSEDGALLRGLLYLPKSALTSETKIPAIVACHGYNNTAEVQSINNIELSRRGMVVFAIDEYGHGKSTFPEGVSIVGDMGGYSALQYLGSLPYIDQSKVGMVGHSMGGTTIQYAAAKAWQNKSVDIGIVAPVAVLPTSQSFAINEETGASILSPYPVNLGSVFGKYDEWAESMWGVKKGSDVNISDKAKAVIQTAENIEYSTYYSTIAQASIPREVAVAQAELGDLKVIYQPEITHPAMHFSKMGEAYIIDFFDITLMGGTNPVPAADQIWLYKEIFTGIALLGFFIFLPSFGVLMLETPFFRTIIRPEPLSPSNPKKGSQKFFYAMIFILALIPAPLVYNWATGYPIDIKAMGVTVPILFPANSIFPMPTANGLVVFNLITGAVSLLLFYIVYKLSMVKRGVTSGNLGIKLPKNEIFKSLLLALIVFAVGYSFLAVADALFKVDFRFWVFSVKTLTAPKIKMFLAYLPFFAFAFLISSLTLNSFTRIRDAKEWQNIVLMCLASMGGLLVFFAADYISLFTTGVKLFPYILGPGAGENVTSALAGVLLMGLLFILPIAAIISRVLFKKSGSIWLGGFVNAFVVTFFAISNTVVSAGVL